GGGGGGAEPRAGRRGAGRVAGLGRPRAAGAGTVARLPAGRAAALRTGLVRALARLVGHGFVVAPVLGGGRLGVVDLRLLGAGLVRLAVPVLLAGTVRGRLEVGLDHLGADLR